MPGAMTRRVHWWLVLLLPAIGGCLHSANQPPSAEIVSVYPTIGIEPLPVKLLFQFGDPDGDALSVRSVWNDDPTSGAAIMDMPYQRTAYVTEAVSSTYLWSGSHRVVLTVSDGPHVVTRTMEFTVLENASYYRLAMLDLTVQERCRTCTVEAPMGGDNLVALGANGCQGFLTQGNGTDCTWMPVPATWHNMTFMATSAGPDVEAEQRVDCAAGPDKTVSVHHRRGDETGKISTAAGCLVLWTADNAPATIHFEVLGYTELPAP